MPSRIVVVGSINLDLVATMSRMPSVGETLSGTNLETFSGGKGANQAVAAARLGADVSMAGRLGQDTFADQLRLALAGEGVRIDLVKSVPGPSGSAVILVDAKGNNSIVVVPGANARLLPDDVRGMASELKQAAMILTQLETPLETVECVAELAREFNVPLMLDPAPARKLPESLLRNVTWLTPNESETRTLLQEMGEDISGLSQTEVAGRLLATGVRNVALKLGADGVFLSGKDVAPTHVPAFAAKAVDTTAAGDAFNGGFAYALCSGKSPAEAARFANAVAAISVTRAGAQPSMPTLAEVHAFLAGADTAVRNA